MIKGPHNPDNAYFAFEWTVKDGWQELATKYQNIKELEIEYYENDNYKKVVSLYFPQEGEIFI